MKSIIAGKEESTGSTASVSFGHIILNHNNEVVAYPHASKTLESNVFIRNI